VLDGAQPPLQNYFLYMFHRVDQAEMDPLAALTMNLRPFRRVMWEQPKDMWSTASILLAAGRTKDAGLYTYEPAYLEVDEQGKTSHLEYKPASPNVQAFVVTDTPRYPQAMTEILRELFLSFPLRPK
jgi:hypothetical protein